MGLGGDGAVGRQRSSNMAGIPKEPYAGITGFMLEPSMTSGKRDMKASLPGDPFL